MKFGKADNLEEINFALPCDHPNTIETLNLRRQKPNPKIYLGLPKWGKTDLPNFYPRGTKNQLLYYSQQFNAIEFNAFFYRIFPPDQVKKWYNNTADDFLFFPKITQSISQFRRLKNVESLVDEFLVSTAEFKEKLGTCFLQMHPSFSPDNFVDLQNFVERWPKDLNLAVELRHPDWHAGDQIPNLLFELLSSNNISHILTDTAGRRDMLHMRLTSKKAFVRFTAGNHPSDEQRIQSWVDRLSDWIEMGLEEFAFFAHIQADKESAAIPAQFARLANKTLDLNIPVPVIQSRPI